MYPLHLFITDMCKRVAEAKIVCKQL